MSFIQGIISSLPGNPYNYTRAYNKHLSRELRKHRDDRDLAFARAVGADNIEMFHRQGDGHVAVLRYHGLADGMAVYDFGCGCGRTAQALQRSGWQGRYTGTDVVERFVQELKRKCPGYDAFAHDKISVPMPDASLDMLFHWSVFTHVSPEECYLHMADSFRALKPGGKLVFSFIELTEPNHRHIFRNRVKIIGSGRKAHLVDTFLHRDWLRWWAEDLGFEEPQFTDGLDASKHPAFYQSLVAMTKPA
jgi:SAM-dependent methyltransferase